MLLIGLLYASSVKSQRTPEIIDTIVLNEKSVILYSDFTWVHAENAYADTNILVLDTTNLFTENWTDKCIFAYLGEKHVPNKFEIELTDHNKPFCLPIYGKLFRGYGRGHDGIDIGLKKGDSIYAAFDGRVRYANYNRGGYGNLIIIRHYNGLETWYGHLSKNLVAVNQDVKAGELIGLGGSTGRSVSPHLHFEVRYRDKVLDPLKFIDFENKKLVSNYKLIVDNNKREPRPYVKYSHHVVRKGDSLKRISKKYGITINEICRLNGIDPKKPLKKGTRLKLS